MGNGRNGQGVERFVIGFAFGALVLGGCFSPDDDGNGSAGSGGASGDAGSGATGGAGTGGVSGVGGTGGIGGVSGTGIGGTAGGIGGMGGSPGMGGAPGFGGDGGFGGGPGECMTAGDCRLVDERCCACDPPTVDQVRAVRFDSDDFGAQCDALCGACPEPTLPVTVVADCVDTACTPVELSAQAYTECENDDDCELRSVDCCGFCGQITLQNSYAVTAGDPFNPCPAMIACPAIACLDNDVLAEAFCTADQHCSVRSL